MGAARPSGYATCSSTSRPRSNRHAELTVTALASLALLAFPVDRVYFRRRPPCGRRRCPARGRRVIAGSGQAQLPGVGDMRIAVGTLTASNVVKKDQSKRADGWQAASVEHRTEPPPFSVIGRVQRDRIGPNECSFKARRGPAQRRPSDDECLAMTKTDEVAPEGHSAGLRDRLPLASARANCVDSS
jgi:hypothetical protein